MNTPSSTLLNNLLKYKKDLPKEEYDRGSRVRPKHTRETTPFFTKPHLKTGNLYPHPVDKIIIRNTKMGTKTFRGKVWGLPVINKDYRLYRFSFSSTARNCHAEINVLHENISVKDQIPLYWTGNVSDVPLPTDCHTGTSFKEYIEELPLAYLGELVRNRSLNTSIPRNKSNEILFLFSFHECPSAYIVSSLHGGLAQGNIDYLSLLPNTDYEIQITFSSDNHAHFAEKIFKVNVVSWDNIIMSDEVNTPSTRR